MADEGGAVNSLQAAELRAAVAEHGRVPVIVSLAVAGGSAAESAAIADAQKELLEALEGLEVSNITRYRFVPAIALTVGAQALERLLESRLVSNVAPDMALRPMGQQ